MSTSCSGELKMEYLYCQKHYHFVLSSIGTRPSLAYSWLLRSTPSCRRLTTGSFGAAVSGKKNCRWFGRIGSWRRGTVDRSIVNPSYKPRGLIFLMCWGSWRRGTIDKSIVTPSYKPLGFAKSFCCDWRWPGLCWSMVSALVCSRIRPFLSLLSFRHNRIGNNYSQVLVLRLIMARSLLYHGDCFFDDTVRFIGFYLIIKDYFVEQNAH